MKQYELALISFLSFSVGVYLVVIGLVLDNPAQFFGILFCLVGLAIAWHTFDRSEGMDGC
jgi:hypothetical protein